MTTNLHPPSGSDGGRGLVMLTLLVIFGQSGNAAAQHAGTSIRAGDVPAAESVTLPASTFYRVGGFHEWLFGKGYRDVWETPIRVPVLDLSSIGGGLVPEDLGGGNSTLSLHLDAANGAEYVFRTVDKNPRNLPGMFDDMKLAKYVARDQTSAKHPAANLVFEPFFDAVHVLHDDGPRLYIMPDDPVLGEYREQLAGRLGVLSLFPSKGEEATARFGVAEILDTDSLAVRLNRHPEERVEPVPYLRARLVDMLLGNWDRHTGNWKWARRTPGSDWEPIARDMDNALVHHDGMLPRLAQQAMPKVITFDSGYPSMSGLLYNSIELDRRILRGTSRATFDSVARWVQDRITDSVIAAGMARMPDEYAESRREIGAKLRTRRDSLPAVADRFYLALNTEAVDIHATDGDERAVVDRVGAGLVEVRIVGPDGTPTFTRQYDARVTREIRLYLHGGDDQAVIRGNVPSSIPVHVIGGNGTNRLLDSSVVAGRRDVAGLHDMGETDDVEYAADTLLDRRPLVDAPGEDRHPGRDFGRGSGPTVGLSTNRDMGVMPELGWAWQRYGFRQHPYASRLALEGRYSFRNEAWAVALAGDWRRAESRLHFTALARMSQLELLNYHGLGNSTPSTPGIPVGEHSPRDGLFAVHQDQWLLHPAVAYALGPKSDVRLGPVVQYSVSNGPPDGFLELTDPYGSGRFGQAGLRASLVHDSRDRSSKPRRGLIVDASADWFPAIWDARSGFGSVGALVGGYVTLPLPLKPYVGLRVAGRKVFGDFPFHAAAFIGGRGGVRTLNPHRYAGDAALAGKLELRIPVVDVHVFLPLEVGVFAAEEVGRVYVDGASPDGWHNTFSAGFWAAFESISVTIRLIEENEVGRPATPVLQVGRSMRLP